MKYLVKYWFVIIGIFAVFMFIEQAICLLILGSLFLFLPIGAILFLKNLENYGLESRGIILEYKSDYEGYKTPIIEFYTTKNELIKDKPYVYGSTTLSGLRLYKKNINSTVIVCYDPNNPEKFVIKEDNTFNYFIFLIFAILGIGVTSLSILELIGVTNLFK
ncbi:MAG: DUF3592 domain-containing protein [Bacteroidota bacterium]